jgi:hypothetical protein
MSMAKYIADPTADYYKSQDGRLFRFRKFQNGRGDLYSKAKPEDPWTRWAEGDIGGSFERKFARNNKLKPVGREETGQEGENQ